jgi:glycosyltransferase involved in cell wall biosynthesis
MRIFWFSNKVQSGQDRGSTGTWLDAMAQALVASEQVQLANVAMGPVRQITRQDVGAITQWIIPASAQSHLHDGLPPAAIVQDICQVIEEFAPDIVQIWGTETFWGLLAARGLIQCPTILDMQGVKSAIARVYHGNLTWREQMACIGAKEIVRGNTIPQMRRRFKSWARYEAEIVSGQHFITVQSPWLEAQVRVINDRCRIFYNDFALRPPFYTAAPWRPDAQTSLFCSASYPSPFKGIHTAVRALAYLKRRFPALELRMAGALQRPGLRQGGYMAWINREARRLGVESSIQWLGALSAEQIVTEMQEAAVIFLPTFIEGYCLALAEAMAMGAPVAVAYVGGAAHLARDEESALYFSPGDVEMAAFQVGRLLDDQMLAVRLGTQARTVALKRNDPGRIIQRQLAIYQSVLQAANGQVN